MARKPVVRTPAIAGLSRRSFLGWLAAAAGAGAVPAAARLQSETFLHRPIPSSGEQIPAIGLGTARTFDVGPEPVERDPLREVLQQFVSKGGRVVDSSPMYGSAETVTGDLATELGLQGRLFYATKVWISGREAGIEQMQNSLRRLRVKRIDLMQIHNLVDWRTHIKTLVDWKADGRIRYLGITHYQVNAFDDLERIMRQERLDFVQLPYSIQNRAAEKRLLPLAADRGIAVLVNEPFEKGILFRRAHGQPLPAWAAEFDCTSWAQFFLKFIVSHPAVTCPIPATSKPAHLVDNMQAGLGRVPDAEIREDMAAYFEGIQGG
jgi:diketogulonate reductase-like aldo/keto reductase